MMNTGNRKLTVSPNIVTNFLSLVHPETRKLVELGRHNDWDVQVLGQAPMLVEHIRLRDWVAIPAHQDSTPIPDHAIERIQAIHAAGLRPKGYVLVHEAPKLLSAPVQEEQEEQFQFNFPALAETTRTVLKYVAMTIGAIALVVGVVVGLVVLAYALAAIASVLFIPAALVVGATGIDPILIAVTEDDYWIEIDRWDIEVG